MIKFAVKHASMSIGANNPTTKIIIKANVLIDYANDVRCEYSYFLGDVFSSLSIVKFNTNIML